MPRHRHKVGPATMLALVVAGGALAAWSRAAGHLMPASGLESFAGEAMLWVAPGVGPVGTGGDLARADVVVVGDSRVGHAVHLSIANGLGVGAVATVWGSGARLEDALPALEGLTPRRVVIALSPLGLVGHQDEATPELLRERHPAFDPESPPHVVRAWAVRETEALVAGGLDRERAAAAVGFWVDSQRIARTKLLQRRRLFDTEGLDARLGHRVDRARALALPTLEPAEWTTHWATPRWSEGSERAYRETLTPERAEERAAAASRVVAAARRLEALGWRVVCVRLPVEPGLRELEDATGTGALLDGIAAALGVPYRDFGAWPGATSDGSHLHWRGADRATRELAAWLRGDVGWAVD